MGPGWGGEDREWWAGSWGDWGSRIDETQQWMICWGWGDEAFKNHSWVCLQPLLPFPVGVQMSAGRSYVPFLTPWVWGPMKHQSGDAESMNQWVYGVWRLKERAGWKWKCRSQWCIDFKWSRWGRGFEGWDHLGRQRERGRSRPECWGAPEAEGELAKAAEKEELERRKQETGDMQAQDSIFFFFFFFLRYTF